MLILILKWYNMTAIDVRKFDSGIMIVGQLNSPAGSIISASGAADVRFAFLKPDGTNLIKTGEVFLDSDGIYKVRFWTISGDLNMGGKYRVQVQLNHPGSGFIGSTNEGELNASRKIGWS